MLPLKRRSLKSTAATAGGQQGRKKRDSIAILVSFSFCISVSPAEHKNSRCYKLPASRTMSPPPRGSCISPHPEA